MMITVKLYRLEFVDTEHFAVTGAYYIESDSPIAVS